MSKVELRKHEELGVIIIQNPPSNTLSGEVLLALQTALLNVQKDDAITHIIITGKGFFSVGAEVREIWDIANKGDKKRGYELLDKANAVVNLVENLGKPTIAAIDGFCLGGGNELAMACTARIATDRTKFGQPEIKLGIMPGMGGTQRLPRLIGLEKAMTLLVSGVMINAKNALEQGLIDKIVPADDLMEKAKKFAERVASELQERGQWRFDEEKFNAIIESNSFKSMASKKSDDAVAAIVLAVKTGLPTQLKSALEIEQNLFVNLVITDGAKKGLAKFLKIDLEPKKTKASTEPKRESDDDREETLKMFREMVRDFAEKNIRPKIAQMEKEEHVPRELFKQIGELGVYGACYPEEYGGSGMGKEAYCVAMEELSRVHGSTATVVAAHTSLACGAIAIAGTEDQKQKYLRGGIEGTIIGAFALTEPDAGSDSANVKTKAIVAEKQDSGWVLNGTKRFITNGPIADFIIVIAQTNPMLGKDGLTAFIVETSWDGFSVGKVEKKIGIHASETSDLMLENVLVPNENMLGDVGQAFKTFMQSLNGGRLGLAAACVGASKRALQLAFEHAKDRVQFDNPILMFQTIQNYLARIRANTYLMESAVYRAARKADAGGDIREEAAIVKLMCSELNMKNVDVALQVHGGDGYLEDSEIARAWRDSRINLIFEGTNEIQQLLIFKSVFASDGKY